MNSYSLRVLRCQQLLRTRPRKSILLPDRGKSALKLAPERSYFLKSNGISFRLRPLIDSSYFILLETSGKVSTSLKLNQLQFHPVSTIFQQQRAFSSWTVPILLRDSSSIQDNSTNQWKDDSSLKDIMTVDPYYRRKETESLLETHNKLLEGNGLFSLNDWKAVTAEQKKIFPIGLVNLLDKAAGTAVSPEKLLSTLEAEYLQAVQKYPAPDPSNRQEYLKYVERLISFRTNLLAGVRKAFPDERQQPIADLKSFQDNIRSELGNELIFAEGYTDIAVQQQLLGSFYKEGVVLPVYNGEICPQYFGLYPALWTNSQKEKLSGASRNRTFLRETYMLVDVPGAGKTFNILASGTLHFLIMNAHYSVRDETLLRERAFSHCVDRIQGLKPWEMLLYAKHEVVMLLFARLLHLWLLLDRRPSLSPQEFQFNQLNGSVATVMDVYKWTIKNCEKSPYDFLLNHLEKLVKNIRQMTSNKFYLGASFDEASRTQRTPDFYYSWKGNKRGILTVIAEVLLDVMAGQSLDFAMFAGTNRAFTDNIFLTSTLAKQTTIKDRIESDFQFISDPVQFLSTMIDLSGCESVLSDPTLMRKIRNSRVRLLTNAIGPFGMSPKQKSALSKTELLRQSLESSYDQIVEDLTKNLVQSSKEVQEKVQRLYLISKYDTKSKDAYLPESDPSVLDLGLTKMYVSEEGLTKLYCIREMAVIEACKGAFKKLSPSDAMLKHSLKILKDPILQAASRGFTVEIVYAEILCLQSGRLFKDLSFLKSLSQPLPEWTSKYVCSMDYEAVSDEAYWSHLDLYLGKLVRLSTSFHGDLFSLWRFDGKYYYLNLSSKLYSLQDKIPPATAIRGYKQTDLSLAYHQSYCPSTANQQLVAKAFDPTHQFSELKTVEGKPAVNVPIVPVPMADAAPYREKIKEILRNCGGSIRIHVHIPNNDIASFVKGNDIVININAGNLNDFLGNSQVTNDLLVLKDNDPMRGNK